MAATASGVERTPGVWEWPDDLLPDVSTSGASPQDSSHPSPGAGEPPRPEQKRQDAPKTSKKERHYKPRTCRICLETVLPTFNPLSESLPEMLQGTPSVKYESEGGRLLSPCKCKGSSRYVHESCLQEWRHADPGYGRRNYWNCPTCGFQYRLGRLSWGHWLSSAVTQITLTILIFMLAVFALGFVADPIINLYLDPVGTIASPLSINSYDDYDYYEYEEAGWIEHFFKGFASLGLVGCIKVFFAMGPWNYFSLRNMLGGNARNATTGRDRVANISWMLVAVGVATFLFTVWKGVRVWSRRILEKASERVMDVGDGADDDDD